MVQAVNPDRWRRRESWQCSCQSVGKLSSNNQISGETMLMQWDSMAPTKLVLNSTTTPPTLVIPSHMAWYSGGVVIKRQTTSPLARPWSSAQRAYWLERSASSRYVRPSRSDNSAGAAPPARGEFLDHGGHN